MFTDFKKTFNHIILASKLEAMRINFNLVTLIKPFMINIKQVVSYKKCPSQTNTFNIGVTQANILGLLLFIIYINELPQYLSSYDLFADDTTVYSNSQTCNVPKLSLQQELINLVKWSYESHMKINISKTTSMLITTKQKLYSLHPVETVKLHNGNILSRKYS